MASISTDSLLPSHSQLAQIYAQACYFVRTGQQQLHLQVGQPAPDLERLLGAAYYLYITAWNPHSQPTSKHQNTMVDQALQHHLMSADLAFHPAWSSDAHGDALEYGWLVLDITQDQADELADTFGQAGILYWGAGEPVRLRMRFAQPRCCADDANIQWRCQHPMDRLI